MSCNGVCGKHKAKKPTGIGRYAAGQKRCQICEIFIKWEGLWCPCCDYRLRSKPRNIIYKTKLLETDLKVGSELVAYRMCNGTMFRDDNKSVLVKFIKIVDSGYQLWSVEQNNNKVVRFVKEE